MKLLIGIWAAALVALLLLVTIQPVGGQTTPKHVVLLYGWNGSPSNWNTAKTAYQAKGYTVHVLSLPRAGWSAGDTKVNADYVQSYIASKGLTDVKLDGHSLGGWLAMYVALVRQDPAVSSVVLRDTGTGCVWGIPGDQCLGSEMLKAITAAPQSPVPILNLNHLSTVHPQVDCTKVFNLSHSAFLTDSRVNAAAIGWSGVSPCSAGVQPVSWEQTAGPSSDYCIGFVCYHTEWACDANYVCWQVQWTYFRGKWV